MASNRRKVNNRAIRARLKAERSAPRIREPRTVEELQQMLNQPQRKRVMRLGNLPGLFPTS